MASAQSIAITPFSVADGDTALVRLGQNLVTTMSANLDGVGEIRVADPVAVLSHARGSGALLSRDAALALARKLGARSAITGTLTRAGALVRADLSMYDVTSPDKPLVTLSRSLPVDSIAALTDSLTWGFLREVWAKGRAPTVNASSIDTRNPAALRDFLEGEQLFGRGAIREAAEAFARASTADTTFLFAHYRYYVARDWYGLPLDTTIMHRLSRHTAQLPERARLLVVSRDSARTLSERAAMLSQAVQRYPDYPPALLAYGDYLVHHMPKIGGEVRDGIAPFQRLVELMPFDLTMAEHLAITCGAAGDRVCAERAFAHFDSLVRADSAPTPQAQRIQRELGFALMPAGTRGVDSIARAALADGVTPNFAMDIGMTGALMSERPDRLVAEDRVYATMAQDPGAAQSARFARIYGSVVRGDPHGVDSARVMNSAAPPGPGRAIGERFINQIQLLLELQGLRSATRATADEALAQSRAPNASAQQRIEATWGAGANALWRGDSAMLREQLAKLTADTSAAASTAARSLRALRLGRSGDQAAAAESLLVIERQHAERRGGGPMFTVLAANRIMGADWLAAAGRPAPADSLLRYTRAFHSVSEHAVVNGATFGAAQLLRSRIAEQMGDQPRAIEFARIFVATFDRAGPEAAGRLAEARDRITRMGGTLEGLPPAAARTP